MTILSKQPLTMAEVQDMVAKMEGKDELNEYFKKFTKVSKADAEKLKKDLAGLNNPKVNEEHLVKIVDFMPQEPEEVHKLFADTSLTEEETNAILEIIKKY